MLVRLRHPEDPQSPLTAEFAVARGQQFVNRPVQLIMVIGALVAAVFFRHSWWFAAPLFGGPVVAWLWWSVAVPRWRDWALGSGVDPDELQDWAEDAKLVWPVGSFWERTEFRKRRLKSGGNSPV